MRMTSGDSCCRYIAAPGTQTKSTPFGKHLEKLGVEFDSALSLASMIERGWIQPQRRVVLPPEAFHAWTNFAVISPIEAENCPPIHEWAIVLYIDSMSSGSVHRRKDWWVADLDEANEFTEQVRAHSTTDFSTAALPPSFRHARANQEVRPWIDFFAYWQAFEVYDYLDHMKGWYWLTSDPATDPAKAKASRQQWVEAFEARLQREWEPRRRAFDWLSQMRTALGSSVMPQRPRSEIDDALACIAKSIPISVEQMRLDVRDTLLRMWQTKVRRKSAERQWPEPLKALLRQEIEYGIHFIERLDRKPIDFLDAFWSPQHGNGDHARLIDALPLELELARRDFGFHAYPYVTEHIKTVPALSHFTEGGLRSFIDRTWESNPAIHRFALALHRLHEQLGGEQSDGNDEVIRRNERIEQFILVIIHAEKILSHAVRARRAEKRFMDVRNLAKESLNRVLHAWKTPSHICRAAQDSAKSLLIAHAQLHELNETDGIPFVLPETVGTCDTAVDLLVSAFVNLVIARNYAAHHDSYDVELVYPSDKPGPHPGAIALRSVIISVLTTLQS